MGFRAGWIALTQVPLLILLQHPGARISSSTSPASHIRGINWLHRWAGRTLVFVSVLPAVFFFIEWVRAGIFWSEWRMMAHVKHGAGGLAVLLWMGLRFLGPVTALVLRAVPPAAQGVGCPFPYSFSSGMS